MDIMKKTKELKFQDYLKLNDGLHDIEFETEINNETHSVYYFKDTDSIIVVLWCDMSGSELKFIKTHHLGSFRDSKFVNLETSTNNWNYENESVYQSYGQMGFDEWIYEHGADALGEFLHSQLNKLGIKIIKK